MSYILCTKILQGADAAGGTVLQKRCSTKILDKYTNKEFLKIPF